MKKIFFLLIGAMMVCGVKAQTVKEGEPVRVYYSPKTSIVLDFTYTEQVETAGELSEYAEELLGITDAITESKTTYAFKGVDITTQTTVDLDRPHTIKAEKGMPWELLHINERGLLAGYNIAPEVKKPAKSNKEAFRPKINPTRVLPYTEEILTAKNEEEKAQSVAKQIFHLREIRMYLLGGEVENAPADGKAMELVLEELAKQEKQLVSLFIGKKTYETKHKLVHYCPQGENLKRWDEVLYFSEDNGFTDADNIDARRIRIEALFQHQTAVKETSEKNAKKDKNAVEASPVVYNLPGNAQVTVQMKDEVIKKRTIPVAQFGIDVPLQKDLFTGNELPKIVFSEKTGNIISISK